MIHHCTPYRSDKDLGKAYNEAFERYAKPGDWVCLRDIDTLFLTHDAPRIIEGYTEMYADAGILTCYTNRVGNKDQLLTMHRPPDKTNILFGETNMIKHLRLAEKTELTPHDSVTELKSIISGMLMVISYKTWTQFQFKEGVKCLGVDTDYSQRILDAGLKIYRMNSIYLWHTYRLLQGISNKKHLL